MFEVDAVAARELAEKAVKLATSDAYSHAALGAVNIAEGNTKAAVDECKLAVSLNAGWGWAHYQLAQAQIANNQLSDALDSVEVALKLCHRDPMLGRCKALHGRIKFALGEFEQSASSSKDAIMFGGVEWPAHAYLIASLILLESRDDAERAVKELHRFRSDVSIKFINEHPAILHDRYEDDLLPALRTAGLRET